MILDTIAAVNEMLKTIGEDPVSALDVGFTTADLALNKLMLVSAREQARGWHFNTFVETLLPDNDGYIHVSDDMLRVDTTGNDQDIDVTRRDGKLWNKEDNTNVFEDSLECVVVRLIDYDDLPFEVREMVCRAASKEFLEDETDSSQATAEKREARARIAAADEDADEADANVFQDSAYLSEVTFRRSWIWGR